MKKNYIGISRDHSGSMAYLARAAAKDYNENIAVIKDRALAEKQDTIVSVVKCGGNRAGEVVRDVVNSNVQMLQEVKNYDTPGNSTPLWDSVGELIEMFEKVPDANDPDVSFLIMIITDGQENSSKRWTGQRLAAKIKELQGSDRWTFVFRVPLGHSSFITEIGIPRGNVLEWETSERGMETASVMTRSAMSNYYSMRSSGAKSTNTFFTDLSAVKSQTVKSKLIDITNDVKLWNSDKDGELIREFCERKSKKPFLKGAAFYQLTKTEKKVQDYKQIVIKDKTTGSFYSGQEARNLLGLPHHGEVKIVPGNHGKYDIFIQSTSVNRKLASGAQVLYWEKVGQPYTEGVSAPWGR
jgi:hypothetical protein